MSYSYTPLILAGLLLGSTGHAQTFPMRFDMGSTSLVAPGFTAVTRTDVYPGANGYGWAPASLTDVVRAGVSVGIVHNHDDDLLTDFVQATGSITFQADLVGNDAYYCSLYLGDVMNPVEDLEVVFNGDTTDPVVTDLDVRTIKGKASYDGAFGGYRRVSFIARTGPAGLFSLAVTGPAGTDIPFMGLEIHELTQPPIVFDDDNAVLTLSPGETSDSSIDQGIVDYNAGDYAAAATSFGQSSDVRLRVWGQAFCVGALKSDMQQIDLGNLKDPNNPGGLIDSIIADLEGPLAAQTSTNSSIRSLYLDALDTRAGALFDLNRGYSLGVFPNPGNLQQYQLPGDTIVRNLSAAVQLLEQVQDDILDPQENPYAAESPFYPACQYLIARNLFSRNTQLGGGNPGAAEMVDYVNEILVDRIWPAVDPAGSPLFDDAHEPLILAWTLVALGGPGIVQLMDGAYNAWIANGKPLPPIDPTTTWWNDLVHPPTPSMPVPSYATWAEAQRTFAFQLRNGAQWWAEERLFGGELGSGAGDDAEFPLLVTMIGRRESADNPFVEGPLSRVYDDILFDEPQVSATEGYVKAAGDVEHNAELSSYPLGILLPMNFGNPRYYGYMMRTMRNMEDAHQAGSGSPNAWTIGHNNGTRDVRHFRSWSFGGTEPPPYAQGPNFAQDVPLNFRAALPGRTLIDYNQSPTMSRLYEEYAWAWRDAAMSTDNNKPVGFFPGAIAVSTQGVPGALGQGTEWYKSGLPLETTFDFDFPMGSTKAIMQELYKLLTEVSRTTLDPNPEDLLEPLANAIVTVPAADPGLAIGTAAQAAWELRQQIANAAVFSRGELLAMDPSLEDDIDDLLQYATTIPGDDYEAGYQEAEEFMRYMWPHLTTFVSYTDRLRLSYEARNRLYTDATTAALDLSPSYVVTWANPESGPAASEADELDCAIRITDFTPSTTGNTDGSLDVLLYNFKSQTSTLSMQVWQGLGLADYTVEIGSTDGSGNFVGTPTLLPTFQYAQRGQVLDVDVVPDDLILLRLTQATVGATPPTPVYDLALDRDNVDFNAQGDLRVFVSNLGISDYPHTSGAFAKVRVRIQTLAGETTFAQGTLAQTIKSPESTNSGLTPKTGRTSLSANWSALPLDTILKIELFNVPASQVTKLNDVIEVKLRDIL